MISHYPNTENSARLSLAWGYNAITVQEYIQGQAEEPFVILRHDADRRPEMALAMAGMERVGKIFYNKADEGDSN